MTDDPRVAKLAAYYAFDQDVTDHSREFLAKTTIESLEAAGLVVSLPTTTPTEIERLDRSKWRPGHPCRDCGALYREHPNAVAGCETWR